MNKALQRLFQIIHKDDSMTSAQKKEAMQSLEVVEKELKAALLKSSTKKAKHTIEVLLKEALTELELRRNDVAAKNRELAIESALDRIRSRSMAMHASHELIEVVRLLRKEVEDLGIHVEATQLVTDFSEPKKGLNIWIAVEGIPILSKFHVQRLDILFVKNFFQAIKRRRAFYTEKYSRAEKNKTYKFLYKHTDFKFIPKERQQVTIDIPAGVIRSSAINKNSVITFQRFGSEAYTEEENAILKRFGNAFEQSYTRFLDLQTAEAQAREAQIEVALERVRAKAMAMNTSDDLKDVALELRRQMGSLGLKELETCAIHLYEGSGEYFTSWAALKSPDSASDIILTEAHLPRKGVRNLEKIIDNYNKRRKDYLIENDWKNFKEFIQALKTNAPEALKVVLKTIRNRKKNEIQSYWSVSDFKGGSLLMSTISMPGEDSRYLLRRFADVFDLAYQRFADLKKAEAQAREAEIQLGLERLRAKTMAMHKSEELLSTASLLFDQFRQLQKGNNPESIDRCAMALANEKEKRFDLWITQTGGTQSNQKYWFNFSEATHGKPLYKTFQQKKNQYIIDLKGKQLAKWLDYLKKVGIKISPELYKRRRINTNTRFSSGFIVVTSEEPLSAENLNLINRFTKVFEQTYTRFLDLQKAEIQAREAQIEAALERVRAAGMAMHSSEDLAEASTVLFEQLVELAVQARRVGFALPNDETKTFTVWSTVRGDDGTASLLSAFFYYDQHPIYPKMIENWHAGNKLYRSALHGKDVQGYYKAWNKTMETPKALLDSVKKNKSEYYQFAYFKQGIIYAFTAQALSEEQNQLLLRFAKAFELTYTRFLDLQKAEAQAREGQIQLALERVRARTMAMQKSEELSETALLMHQQFRTLTGLPEKVRMVISILREDARLFDLYITSTDGTKLDTKYSYSIDDPHVFQPAYQAVKNKKPSFIIELSGNPLKEYLAFMESQSYPVTFRERVVITSATFSNGYFCLVTADSASNEKLELLGRFAKVFEQTYTRFLDLQKAETQAREAQIQLALERVRARTMAMQSSEELAEVSFLLNKQVMELGIPTRGCAFNIYGENESTEWFSNHEGTLPTYKTPREKIFLKYYEGGQRGETLLIEEFGGRKIKDHYQYLYRAGIFGKDVTQEIIKEITPEYQIDHIAYFKYGYLLFITLVPAPAAHDIFIRFAKEFEQTYVRFLDLQKAEAQAKEAQIETSLERVRAQAMAMHHSDDLNKTIRVYFEQLDNLLNANVIRCGAGLLNKENTIAVLSTASRKPDGEIYDVKGVIDMKGHPLLENTYKHWLKQQEYSHVLTGNQTKEYYQYMTNQVAIPDIKGKDQQYFYFPMFTEGSFYVVTNNALNESDLQIFRRFSSALSLTYRRFNDLQKAEAQAREAQIEAALERVRSLTMAMHSSEDVGNCIVKMFDELTKLGVDEGTRFGIGILNRANENNQLWTARKYGNEVKLHIGNLDMTLHPLLISARAAWKKQVPLHQYVLQGDDLLHYYEMLNAARDYKIEVAIEKLPDKEFHYGFIFEHGFFYAFSPCEFQPGLIQTAQRFSALFEQTYRRYLDLQKAEAQAREALIEVALERVRSRSLAMHKAEELGEVVTVVLEKLRELDIPVNDGVALVTHIEGSKDQIEWTENPGYSAALRVYQPYYDHPILADYWKAKEKGLDFIAPRYTAKQNRSFLKHIFEHTDYKHVPQEVKDYCLAAKTYSYSAAFQKHSSIFINDYSGRSLSEPEIDIVKRFSRVFEQAYTRFLDLQKAEEQAREALIEAALERIRARALAMHSSHELTEVANVLREQMGLLGQAELEVSAIHLYAKDADTFDSWWAFRPGAKSDGKIISGTSTFRINTSELAKEWIAFFQSDKTEYTTYASGEKLKAWLDEVSANANEITKYWDDKTPAEQYFHNSDFSGGSLVMVSLQPPLQETKNLQKRAASVFDLAYRRYLDLQKAETQAREAEIQLALERVRARTMAMQKSDELREVVGELFHQVQSLGIEIQMFVIFIFRPDAGMEWWGTKFGEEGLPQSYDIPPLTEFADHPRARNLLGIRKNKTPYQVFELSGNEKKSWDKFLLEKTGLAQLPGQIKKGMRSLDKIVLCDAVCEHGILEVAGQQALSNEHENILRRFAKVFEQTYTRFLDVQKAEIQAREAQIEAALEKVRSRSLAMHHSNEIKEVVKHVFEKMKDLGFFQNNSVMIVLPKNEFKDVIHWTFNENFETMEYYIPSFNHRVSTDPYEAWKRGEKTCEIKLNKEEKNDFLDQIFTHTDYSKVPEEFKKYLYSTDAYSSFEAFENHCGLLVDTFTSFNYSQDQKDVVKRFAGVFEQAYIRFLDLQKAEEQAREAQIEASLERVRSRTMAMQHSNELQEAALLLFQQIQSLGTLQWGCGFVIWDDDKKAATTWSATGTGFHPPYRRDSSMDIFVPILEAAQRGESILVIEQSGKDLEDHYNYLGSIPVFRNSQMEDWKKAGISIPAFQIFHAAFFPQGYLHFISFERIPEYHDIFIRFAKVFEQTYTRFNDLKKAEAQTREAQIETALERVRSRSMAMHVSDELLEVIAVISQQLSLLGFRYDNVSFAVNTESDDYSFWTYFGGLDKTAYIHVPYINNPMYQRMHKVFEEGNDFYEDVVAAEDNRAWIKHMFAHNELNFVPQEIRDYLLKSPFTRSIALTPRIMLILGNYASKPYSEDQNKILKRFAAVFDQSYVRFLDLKKAEEQAREAQIEAALERIRSRSMAMHKSDELAEVSGVLYQELVKLGLTGFVNCGFVVIDEKRSNQEGWTTTPDGGRVESYFLPLMGDEIFDKRYEAWKAQVPVFIQRLGGEQLKNHMELALPTLGSRQAEQIARENFPDPTIFYCCNFRQGYLCIVTGQTFSEEYEPVLVRFSKVFEQTYTRFLDLQKAEASAKLAIKQSSLDRVRAEIASMREAQDLERITPLIWKELIALDVPFIRCGVFIMDDHERLIHNFLSTPDGKAIATFQLPYDTPGFVADILKHWQIKKEFVDHWDERAMMDFADILVSRGIFTTSDQYLKTLPKEGFYLHFLPFLQGMLYVGNMSQLGNDSLDLLQSLADSFSTAYSRYDDFNKLESAKRQVDKTLVDLKQAQQQLVQSEKMASLGELTAGIAHEIQNPLNFVNNFSELNKELLTEMEEAIEQGDFEEATAIARNIANNQEKINLHGKRAEGIVKGMLQHSRSSSGQKELTDINALCDEYLRLSYHGYRAKDKSFNAKFETEFEPMLPRISVISQDIGRVVLNLINNAFYAVNEKSKQQPEGYEPTVTVNTKLIKSPSGGLGVLISVKDNGNGIPLAVKEKIFQPFFTTKPTGQGTGLGLSLSYDIVKAHGGELKVETIEGKETEFVVQLP